MPQVVRRQFVTAFLSIASCTVLAAALLLIVPLFQLHATAAPLQAGNDGARVVDGAVVDSSGGAIAGAEVTLRSSAGERRTVTDGAGLFLFRGVPAAAMQVTVSFDGFSPETIDLTAPRQGLRIVLQPLPLSEAVTVLAPLTRLRSTTATRTDTPLRDVPQAVSVITRDLIADQTMRSMADVVQYVPGVGMAQGEGHRDAPIFRGNTSTADFLVDGLRDDTQYLRDLYNVDRIEVLKGPNGMLFGRGGAGGVINRVTRQADWTPVREVVVQAGRWGHRRLTSDLGHATTRAAVRLAGLYEDSDTYRDGVEISRAGLNPTVAFALGANATFRAGYEFFRDERTTDRGVPSLHGRPLDTDPSAFFGSIDVNTTDVTVNALSTSLEYRGGAGLVVRNRSLYADYDKFYQNLVPGAVDAAQDLVTLSGYNNATARQNFFNQTDFIVSRRTGAIEHDVVAGMELGRQVTDNLRQTGFFTSLGPTVTSIRVPLSDRTTSLPVEFRASASDATNHGVATVMAAYVQDQVALTRQLEAIVGVRYDRFRVDLRDHRTGAELEGDDDLISPRVGLLYKPTSPLSLYASYTRAYVPRAGEQLSSLTPSNQTLEPEEFRNYEVGAKWELTAALSFTTAVYRLDRGNVVVRDPVDPTVSLLVDGARTAGAELELSGRVFDRWSLQGGYAYQDAEITRSLSDTMTEGARLAQVPRHSFSLWNKYDVSDLLGVGLGVISRGDSFVATDNTVVLPGFTRVDAAVFLTFSPKLRAQINLENALDERYYPSAHNNNNILPGSPRAFRVALTSRF